MTLYMLVLYCTLVAFLAFAEQDCILCFYFNLQQLVNILHEDDVFVEGCRCAAAQKSL